MANVWAPFYYEKALGTSHCNNPCSFPLLLCYVLTLLILCADETKVVLLDHTKLGVDIIQIMSHCSNLRNKSGNMQIFSRQKKNPSTCSSYQTGTVALGKLRSLIFRRCRFKHTNNTGLFGTYVTHEFNCLSAGTSVLTYKIWSVGYKRNIFFLNNSISCSNSLSDAFHKTQTAWSG